MGKVIGIDLGTTNSCVAILEGGQPIVIANSEGGRTTPSVVAFGKGSDRLVGQLAKRQAVTNAENTIYSIKRFIGRRWDDTASERQRVTYKCVKGRDDTVDVQIRGRNYTPQEISAMILYKLKQDAENFLGETVDSAVITVPAYFTDAQRQATKDAGTIAGLEVLRIVNEPTAAALAYGLDKGQEQKILVFDLGGGTFDVSILQLGDGVFEVKATSGNNHLGGDDFDNCIVLWMLSQFQEQEKIDLSQDKMATQRLREAAEKAKIELSTLGATSINLPFITADATGPKHLAMELSRSKFEEIVTHLVGRTIEPMVQALKDSELKPAEIDKVILVGGSTRIPAVQSALQKFFGGKATDRSVNPDEAVALGAAIQGGVLSGEVQEVLLLDVTPLSLGIETLGEVFTKVIERNRTIPTSKAQIFSTATDGQISVEIHVLQGERAMATDNNSLGRFVLAGIPPAPRGMPQIEVSFEIDVNGILKVAAQDKGTGKEQSIRITSTGGLSTGEIERMRQEAEIYADQDKKRIDLIDLKNQAENLIYSYESTLKDNGTLIAQELKLQAEESITLVRGLFDDPKVTTERVHQQIDNFQQLLLTIGTSVYRKANSSGASDSIETTILPTNRETSPQSTKTSVPITQEEFDLDFAEEDSTVTVDYEAIE